MGEPVNYTQLFNGGPNGTEDHDYQYMLQKSFQEDMCKLKVYFASSKTTIMKEFAIYPSVFDLFINLGGALSLWMGLSFIMFVEVVEILVDILIGCLQRYVACRKETQ